MSVELLFAAYWLYVLMADWLPTDGMLIVLLIGRLLTAWRLGNR